MVKYVRVPSEATYEWCRQMALLRWWERTTPADVIRTVLAAAPQPNSQGILNSSQPAEALARQFHEAYERLAPQFGYETRAETRQFDPQSPNGRLMVAVCAEIMGAAPQQPAAQPVIDHAEASGGIEGGPQEDRIEAAYWRFDARRKGYEQWKKAPMSERDAFKAEMRNALEVEKVRAEMRLVARGWQPAAQPASAEPWVNVRGCGWHHYTPKNIDALIDSLRRVESGDESVENWDMQTQAGILWRVISALSHDVPLNPDPVIASDTAASAEPVAWRLRMPNGTTGRWRDMPAASDVPMMVIGTPGAAFEYAYTHPIDTAEVRRLADEYTKRSVAQAVGRPHLSVQDAYTDLCRALGVKNA
jgi:hypothetical protein